MRATISYANFILKSYTNNTNHSSNEDGEITQKSECGVETFYFAVFFPLRLVRL